VFYKWDASTNRGFTFGYYGELNTVKQAAGDLPDVAAVRVAAANIDIGLEEFSIEVSMNDGRKTTLGFLETDALRSQSGPELSQGLAVRLSSQFATR
jgi:hypothetical protein